VAQVFRREFRAGGAAAAAALATVHVFGLLARAPLVRLCSTAVAIIRNSRLDIGFTVESCLGDRRLNQATVAA